MNASPNKTGVQFQVPASRSYIAERLSKPFQFVQAPSSAWKSASTLVAWQEATANELNHHIIRHHLQPSHLQQSQGSLPCFDTQAAHITGIALDAVINEARAMIIAPDQDLLALPHQPATGQHIHPHLLRQSLAKCLRLIETHGCVTPSFRWDALWDEIADHHSALLQVQPQSWDLMDNLLTAGDFYPRYTRRHRL